MQLNIGFLASHTGSSMRAIVEAITNKELIKSDVRVIISNNSNSFALNFARENKIHAFHISSITHKDEDRTICSTLLDHDVNLIILSGYMKKLGNVTLEKFNNRILNIHPALLPNFGGRGMYGKNVHEAVLKSGQSVSGATVHLVNSEYDVGRVIAQYQVPIMINDTVEILTERVKQCEQKLIVDVVKRLEDGSIQLD